MNYQISKKQEKFRFVTLGCRLNQYETQAMRESLCRQGYREADSHEAADVVVINTCTVTEESDKKNRSVIRRCHRENPNARMVVTGCYVTRNEKRIAAFPGVTHVLSNRQKTDLAACLDDSCTALTFDRTTSRLPHAKAAYTPLQVSTFSARTRAFIKVQDGCNHACSFCKVVLVRGKSRSRPVQEVVEEAKRLRDNGYSDIVLTGIQLGAYGLDFPGGTVLAHLIEAIHSVKGIERIRLSSIEPADVTETLIGTMQALPKVCPHLHIPLQSGSDAILKTMNRRYRQNDYRRLIVSLRERLIDFVLTTDVMVGFPGEEECHFQETVNLLFFARPYKLHIFPYSPREGTRAFRLGTLPASVTEKRKQVLFEMEVKLRDDIFRTYIGRTVTILLENSSRETDWAEGRAPNYLPVRLPKTPELCAGRMVDVHLTHWYQNRLVGERIPERAGKTTRGGCR